MIEKKILHRPSCKRSHLKEVTEYLLRLHQLDLKSSIQGDISCISLCVSSELTKSQYKREMICIPAEESTNPRSIYVTAAFVMFLHLYVQNARPGTIVIGRGGLSEEPLSGALKTTATAHHTSLWYSSRSLVYSAIVHHG